MTNKFRFIEENSSLFTVGAFAALIFIPFLGSVHLFDWDEINFAESAREMLLTQEYFRVQINYQAFWEKPPFFFWLQALSMSLFGVNEFAARFPNALCGIITLMVIFNLGKKHASRSTAIWWVLMMAGSFTPHLYFKSGIIDPWFNLFIFLSVYHFISSSTVDFLGNKDAKFLYSGAFAGLALITKGPVSLLIIGLCVAVFMVLRKFKRFFSFRQLLLATIPFVIISSLWILAEVSKNGFSILEEFIAYQLDLLINPVAGHGQPFYYHAVVILIGCFPASLFFIPSIKLGHIAENKKMMAQCMAILFWVVLVLFSSVTTKIVHYSSLCYLPLTFLAATYIDHLITSDKKIPFWLVSAILFMGLIIGTALTGITFIEQFKNQIIPYINDPFAVDSLTIDSPWTGAEFIPGLLFVMVYLFQYLLLRQHRTLTAMRLLFLGSSLLIPVYMYVVVGKIEAYSQGPAIAFFKSFEGEDVIVETYGHKSYAQYFYTKSKPGNHYTNEELLNGKADKPTYFVAKNSYWKKNPHDNLEFVNEKGGFTLLRVKLSELDQ